MHPFVHLHVHSQYSLLDGQASIENLVDKAINDGMKGIALTDHGVMYGIKEFTNYVSKKNKGILSQIKDIQTKLETINEEEKEQLEKELKDKKEKLFKPIIGCECYVARKNRFSQKDKIDASGWHLIILVKNIIGYKNLIKIVSKSWKEGFYYRPRIDKELLSEYHEGLIISSACLGGELARKVDAGNIEEARETVKWFKSIFKEDYYIELQRHKTNRIDADQTTFPKQERVNKELIKIANENNVKIIATNDVHFVNEEDAEAHDRLICLSTGKDFDDPNRMHYTKQEWLKTTLEMNRVFEDLPESLTNTIEVLNKIEFFSLDNNPLMPFFNINPEFGTEEEYKKKHSEENLILEFGNSNFQRLGGYNKVIRIKLESDYLSHLAYIGATDKYKNITEELKDRIDFEINTIKSMGFPGYFLIVQDFISAAKKMNVVVGPGRGSVAGSAVAYCLGITDIDPIKYNLLFERFLNPDRISMPDIDIDFDDEGRGKVLRWVTEKYGSEKVAHIITYGTMATKSSIRDVARVHKLSLSESDRLAKLVPDRLPNVKKINLKTAIENVPQLKEAENSNNPIIKDTIKYAKMLEGNIRSTGVHACGIIIGQTDISDIVPISTAEDKETKEKLLVTQYEGSVIEETGLIKMDFLGLKTLSIIKEAVYNIEKTTGQTIDINNIDLSDKKTYNLYSKGDTTGTFQFESAGMQKYLKELQPTKFEDLIAMNALYRPGPMEYIPSFIARKHGKEKIKYDIPIMGKYLSETYGITVYQEQVMLLSRLIGNFSRGESDELRKAMGKKMIEKMNNLKEKFIIEGTKNGYNDKVLDKIWKDWEKFALYAFNKSHATCYSWIAYQTAWLKANYPSQYMSSVLSNNLNNITEITKFMDECKAMSINVLSPDINESFLKFSVNKSKNIRFGLAAIKNVGQAASNAIIEERKKNGSYKNIFDFVERVNLSSCNKKNIESLALAGAFDSFGNITREQIVAKNDKNEDFIDTLIRYGNQYQQDKYISQNNLFGDDVSFKMKYPDIPTTNKWSDIEKLNKEKELIGIYLSAHPLDSYKIILDYGCNTNTIELQNLDSYKNKNITFGGLVVSSREGQTKNGNMFNIFKIEDYYGSYEIALFGDDSINFSKFARQGLSLFIEAKIQQKKYKQDELEIKIKSINLLSEIKDTILNKININLFEKDINKVMSSELNNLIKNNFGNSLLYVNIINEKGKIINLFSRNFKVSLNKNFITKLKELNINFKIN